MTSEKDTPRGYDIYAQTGNSKHLPKQIEDRGSRDRSESVLVIAFDGLDKELIKEFNLDHIRQEEFGSIDNDTGISKRKTSELFTSFLTGKTHQVHEVTDLKTSEKKWQSRILDAVAPEFLVENVDGFHRIRKALKSLLDLEERAVNYKDYEKLTLLDEIDNSKALDVPSYNPSPYWSKLGTGGQLADQDVEKRSRWKYWDKQEYWRRHRNLFRPVNQYFDFCIAHFHRVDVHQHFYGSDIHFDKERLKKLYKETDELANDIIEFFEDSYDTIIFMSDHGCPEADQHNKNAFYSCNRELFGDRTPHITSFHDRILELVSAESISVERKLKAFGELENGGDLVEKH